MAKMCITIVLDADRATVRKVKNRIMDAAKHHLISCSATYLESPHEQAVNADLSAFRAFRKEDGKRVEK